MTNENKNKVIELTQENFNKLIEANKMVHLLADFYKNNSGLLMYMVPADMEKVILEDWQELLNEIKGQNSAETITAVIDLEWKLLQGELQEFGVNYDHIITPERQLCFTGKPNSFVVMPQN